MPTRTALLIDFDNLFIALWEVDREAAMRFASEPGEWLQALANSHLTGEPRRWLVTRCYLNPAGYVHATADRTERLYFSRFRPGLVRAGFEVIDCPVVTRQGKNAADIRIVLDVMDLLNHKTQFDEFVLGSGDADFTPLLQRIRAADRRIAVVSPSYLASAYTAIADQIVDFDAMTAILHSDAGTDAVDDFDGANGSAATVSEEEQQRFAELIRQRYDEATGPLNLASLAFEAARVCPNAKRSEWFGHKSFSAAVAVLELPDIKLSQHHLWNDAKHQPPAPTASPPAADVPETIALLMRALDFPRLAKDDWSPLFDTLALYAEQDHADDEEVTRWVSEKLAQDHGIDVPRGTVSYVVRGCQFGGVRLDGKTAPTADQLSIAFFNALLDRTAALGSPVTPEEEDTLADWLGLELID
ncbi:NYN domain-containing protein [Altererythrobacter xixiisoli]|uniref:NYN domain-containing protein n=1 Tax=Croceibacterium xixiisoli TaxID=1476466 RepID=A0A6I4TRA4_9SPHN|nr:NYN domain-containing protein [Croceibacterium xixiisoli]MXO98414.1 NYN domain-containing protein [Croceibacterium xixiisoli]